MIQMNTLVQQDLKATARVPLLTGTRLLLARSLANGESYYEVAMSLQALADEAARLPSYVQSQFARSLYGEDGDVEDVADDDPGMDDVKKKKDDAGGKYQTRTERYLRVGLAEEWRRFVVFMSIPRHMLESIVLGTVAWDYDRNRGEARDRYRECQGFGIYVIGLQSGLVYTSESAVATNNRWSLTFAQRLQVLIAHPFFQGSIPWIRLAIQWAAICRQDDHRSHVFPGGDSDVFLRILGEVYEWQNGSHRPPTLRRLAHRLYLQKYCEDSARSPTEPLWGRLMGHIEELACPADEAPHEQDPTAPDVYEVTTADLTTVIRALDQVRGLVMFREQSDIIWETTQLVKSTHDIPVTDDCRRAIQAVLLHEERLKREQELAAEVSSPVRTRPRRGPLT